MTEPASKRRRYDDRPGREKNGIRDDDRRSERISAAQRDRSRSRSWSPDGYSKSRKHEDRERRGRDGRRSHRDDRTRSRSPVRTSGNVRQRTPPRGPRERDRDDVVTNGKPTRGKPPPAPSKASGKQTTAMDVDGNEDEDEETAMLRVMGFGTFRSTKNTKVPGNEKNYGVSKNKKAEYRQYMNRKGGFNRPLSPSR